MSLLFSPNNSPPVEHARRHPVANYPPFRSHRYSCRPQILGLYDDLHACGVCHMDLEVRHIRRRLRDGPPSSEERDTDGFVMPNLALSILDFDQSTTDCDWAIREESKTLRTLLGASE